MQKRYFRTAQDLASPRLARYYLDTCIWRDYFENREDRFGPLGDWAFRLIRQIVEEESTIIYSDIVIEELTQDFSAQQISSIFAIVPSNLLIKAKSSFEETKAAAEMSKILKIPGNDILHALIAKNNKAIMVTRDKHFQLLRNIVVIKCPEELI